MSEENVEIVREVLEAWNRGELDAAVRRFAHEDVELRLIGGFADLVGETFVGRERVVGLWREMTATLGLQFKVEEVFDAGERVAVILSQQALGAESGAPTTLRPGYLWTFRDGKVIRVDAYYRASDALQAAGLQE
jgi:ketosteroid isomerase-like protein